MKKAKKIRVRGSLWKHPKKGKQLFLGKYRFVRGEREFHLVNCARLKDKVIPFNSSVAAQSAGWKIAKLTK